MATRGSSGGGLERMVGIIATMAQIQNQRKQLAMEEERAKTQKEQFKLTMGFNEKTENAKRFDKAYDRFIESSLEERASGDELVDGMGFSPGEAQILKNIIRNAPETIESLKRTAATRGYRGGASATPFQQEAAATNVLGLNRGGAGLSGIQAQLAQSAQGQLTPFMGREFAQRAAGGNSVMEAGVGQQLALRPELMRKLAEVQAGTSMTAAQASQAEIGRQGNEVGMAGVRQRGTEAEMNIAMQLATKKAAGQMTMDDIISGSRALSDKAVQVGNAKLGSGVRRQLQNEYNHLAIMMGFPELIWDDKKPPTPAGIAEQMYRKVRPAQPGPVDPSKLPPGAMNNFSPNSLTPFLRQR